MATIALGIAGAVGGYLIGGPKQGLEGAKLGFAIGTEVGSFVDAAHQKYYTSDMGKLSDLRITVASYGSSIPQCWGITRVPISLIWSTDLIEHEQDQGGGKGKGKGGGVTTRVYTYSCSFAAAICRGKSSNRIDKIYADDLVIFDRSQSGNTITAINDSFATQVGESIKSASFPEVTIRYYFGTETQNADPLILTASNIYLSAGSDNPAFRGTCYIVFESMYLTKFGNRVPNINVRLNTGTTYLSDVVTDFVSQVGINTGTQLDVTAITALQITGILIDSRTDVVSCLKPLGDAYNVDFIDVDGKIKAVVRGGSSIATITWADMGSQVVGSGTAPSTQRIQKTRADNIDLTSRLDLGYFSPTIDLQQATQGAVRQTARQKNYKSVQYPLTLNDDEARRFVEKLLYLESVERTGFQTSVQPSFANLTVADPVLIQVDSAGNTKRARITEAEAGLRGEIRLTLVRDDSNILSQGQTGVTPTGGTVTNSLVPTLFFCWSGVELTDQDSTNAGFYVAANGLAGWAGGVIYVSVDGGTTYLNVGSVTQRTVFGTVSNVLGSTFVPNGNGFDVTNTSSVSVNGTLASTSETQVLNGQGNYGLILQANTATSNVTDYELLGFATATFVSIGNYTLSDFLRAQRSTPKTGHANTDKFVQITGNIVRIPVASSLVGSTILVKVVSPGVDITTVSPQTVFIATPSNIFATTAYASTAGATYRTPFWRMRGYLGGTKTTSIDETYFLDTNGNGLTNHFNNIINVAIGGTTTGGSFTIFVQDFTAGTSATTAAIAFNASAATVKSAIEALGIIGAGNLTVTGGPLNTSAVIVNTTGASIINHNIGMSVAVNSLTGGAPTLSVTVTQTATNDQYWQENSLSAVDLVWRYETPGMGYTTYARANITNPTGSSIVFNWWVPARDNTLRVRVNGSFVYDNGSNDVIGSVTVTAGSTFLIEIFYYNNPATYNPADPGTAMFKTNAIEKGLTWSDAGK